ncbi:MAG: 23S rRNA (uracil(1939)-C(5))-methyltransferase RlmD [Bacteroidota bacterium]|nr:23S rRNA (uracil(1939)-C(5))-methyltransferase RlmD [Bacteroidota bacterium]
MQNQNEIILKIDSLSSEGKGVARSDGKVFFVAGGVPGDVVRCVEVRSKKTYSNVRVIEILEPSQYRVQPRCEYFGTCGGCKLQYLDYKSQLVFKYKNVVDAFERIGGIKNPNVLPVIGSGDDYFYRNKMEFTFSNQKWLTREEIDSGTEIEKTFGLGLHIPKVFDKVLDIDECWLQKEQTNKIINFTREFVRENALTIYTTNTHEGYLRHLVIRTSEATGEIMVNLVTTYDKPSIMKKYTELLTQNVHEVTTVVNNVTSRKSMVAVGETERVYYGGGFIYEKLGGYKFRISANSFFQTNSKQAERLYSVVKEYASLKGDEVVYDLYSGTGSIALYISDSASEVVGIEVVESAIQDAKLNAELNQINNCHFIQGDLKEKLTKETEWLNHHSKPDVIILDPPRSGMHPKVVTEIAALKSKRIVYVSCNPTTQARDIKMLIELGYILEAIQPVDMFPQTFHIETVTSLTHA